MYLTFSVTIVHFFYGGANHSYNYDSKINTRRWQNNKVKYVTNKKNICVITSKYNCSEKFR